MTTRRAGLVYHTNPYDTLPSWYRVFGQNSGTAIFSRHPILNARSAVFGRGEAVNYKGFTAAEVSLGEASALFVCTHFEARNANIKRSQMKQLSDELLPLVSNVRYPAIVCAMCRIYSFRDMSSSSLFRICAGNTFQTARASALVVISTYALKRKHKADTIPTTAHFKSL